MPNPTTMRWTGPTAYADGTTFGASDLAGFEIRVQGRPAVNVPLSHRADNQYSFNIADLSLPFGTYSVTVATVARNGQVSAPSNAVSFTLADERRPNPPTSLTVA